MKQTGSIKKLKKRHPSIYVVRRKKHLGVRSKENRKFNARQS